MLSLRLKSGEYLTIGENIAVQIFRQTGDSFEVAVKAPREIPVLRGEVFERSGRRPEGLRESRQKSPSQRNSTAKRQTALARQEELRENRLALMEKMAEVLNEMEAGAAGDGERIAVLRRLLEQLGEELG